MALIWSTTNRSISPAGTDGDGLDSEKTRRLLSEMQQRSKPIKPARLGIIGEDHIKARFEAIGCDLETFEYKKVPGEADGVPYVIEAAFAMMREYDDRRLVLGANWTPAIGNPFRHLDGKSLNSILEKQRAWISAPRHLLQHPKGD